MKVYVLQVAVDDYSDEQRVVGVFASRKAAQRQARAEWIAASPIRASIPVADEFFDDSILEMDVEH